jgi:hypothetical protein
MVRVGGAGLLGQMGERGEKEAGRGQLRWRGVWYGRRSGVVVCGRGVEVGVQWWRAPAEQGSATAVQPAVSLGTAHVSFRFHSRDRCYFQLPQLANTTSSLQHALAPFSSAVGVLEGRVRFKQQRRSIARCGRGGCGQGDLFDAVGGFGRYGF